MSNRRDRYLTAQDGALVYVTIDGDMVDDIARFYYGTHAGNTERVLEANPGLADLGAKLRAGIVIRIPPAITSQQATPFRRLWD